MYQSRLRKGRTSTFHVYQVGGQAGREQGNQPMTEWQSTTLHSLLWGLLRQDLAIENCSFADGSRTGIEEIRIEKKPLQRIALIVTLGIWMPLTVSWRCAKRPGPRGEL